MGHNMSEQANRQQASANHVMNIVTKLCIASFILAVIVTLAFFAWWGFKDRIVFGHDKFDQVVWMTSLENTDQPCKRGDMAYDLQQNILQQGLTLDKVTLMLGRPTWDDGDQIEYDLGKCMHVEHGLRLFFNAQHQLTHSRITQH